MEIALLLFVYSLLSIFCAVVYNVDLQFLIKLFICLLFTPILGYLILRRAKKYYKDQLIITHFFCRKCGLESSSDDGYCPSCMNEGQLTILTPNKISVI